MKKLLLFAALVLGAVSCMKDNSFDANAGGEAEVVLSVALPADVTRAINQDSAKGAIGNIDLAQYDIRYILEVFDASNTLAKRVENYEDSATSTTFELRLIPGRHYSFVVWADFVAQGSEDALHYNAESLREIEIIGGVQNAMDESRDAYTGIFRTSDNGGQPFSSSSQISFELKRPFAKLRVVTNDIDEIYKGLKDATIEYTAQTYQQYDALAKQSSEPTFVTKYVDYTSEAYKYDGEPTEEGVQTLFADYILGTENGTIQFDMTIADDVQTLPTINFNTSIPVQRNYLTTIYGPILTDSNNVTVTINPAFENKDNFEEAPYYQTVISSAADLFAAFDNGGEYILIQDLTITSAPATVSTLAATRSTSTETVVDLNGHIITVKNTSGNAMYEVEEGQTLTFTGNGSIALEEDSDPFIENNGTVVIETFGVADDAISGEPTEYNYTVYDAEGMLAFAAAVNGGNTFEGQTITLAADIDLTGYTFCAIGHNPENYNITNFKGIFDGNNKTIKGISRWDSTYASKRSVGLFARVENATVKNLKLDNFVAATYGGEAGAIACVAVGDCLFENLSFTNGSVVSYNNDTSAVVGWANVGNFTFKNINIANSVTIYSLWDSYDTTLGGVIGTLESPSTATIENVNIACVLNAFNDVAANYQWYAYRRTGMVIGNMSETMEVNGRTTPDPKTAGVTCKNVTVTYGDWMNYHYCEFEANGKPSYADEGDWKFSRVEGQEWGREENIDTDNCQHDTDETHNICLPVDQLFGGGQGVYGLREYEGVTVNYPASYRREVASAAALTEALGKGLSVVLDADIDFGTTQLAITGANQVVDLGGHTLTTNMAYGGIALKNGASIVNGTINHTSSVAAIKAFNVGSIENVTINTTCTTANKTVTGIAVQQGGYVGSIKNVTINGVSQGIEVGYQATVDLIENVTVEEHTNGTANGIGLVINGGKVGLAKNSTFKGDVYGVTMHLKGVFAVGLELENCQVEGATAAIYAWDEKGISNTSGSLNLTYDAATTLTGPFVWDFEEECQSVVTLNRPQ